MAVYALEAAFVVSFWFEASRGCCVEELDFFMEKWKSHMSATSWGSVGPTWQLEISQKYNNCDLVEEINGM